MKLTEFRARNFRLLENFHLTLSDDVTLLVGPNNSGKSSVVDAFLLIKQALNTSIEAAYESRQGYNRIVSRHNTDQTIDLEFSFSERKPNDSKYKATLSKTGYEGETIVFRGQTWNARKDPQHSNTLSISKVGSNPNLVGYRPDEGPSLLGNGVYGRDIIRPFLASISHSDPVRVISPLVQVSKKIQTESTGQDLAQVLSYYQLNNRDLFSEYERKVQKVLPEVRLVETPLLDGQASSVTISVKFAGDSEKYNLWQLSSGLKDVMALMANIQFSLPDSLVILEEPESHLHPAAQKSLAAVIREAAKSQGKQFILTTHSDVLLSQFDSESARFFDKRQSSVTAVALKDIDPYKVARELGFDRNSVLLLLGKVPQVIVVLESEIDQEIIESILGHRGVVQSVVFAKARGGGFKDIVDHARALTDALSRFGFPSQVFVLLDNDGERDAKLSYLQSKGFHDEQAHVWVKKEIESYLVLPRAFAKLSGKSFEDVGRVVQKCRGQGKAALVWVLRELGLEKVSYSKIVRADLEGDPSGLDGEVLSVSQKIEAIFGRIEKPETEKEGAT